MKIKLFALVAILGAGAIFSCNDKGNNEPDAFNDYIQWYSMTTIQNDLALDPFNVAYRLNVYLKAANEERDAVRAAIFKNATITKNGNVYTVEYIYTPDPFEFDRLRTGRVLVDVSGGANLDEAGNSWKVYGYTPADPVSGTKYPYVVGYTGGMFELKINNGGYTVTAEGGKKWRVEGKVYQQDMVTNRYSDWRLAVRMTQTKGGADYASLDGEMEFEMETIAGGVTGGASLEKLPIRYTIINPVVYTTRCDTYQAKTAGKENIVTYNNTNMLVAVDSIYFEMSRAESICAPAFKITAIVDGEEVSRDY